MLGKSPSAPGGPILEMNMIYDLLAKLKRVSQIILIFLLLFSVNRNNILFWQRPYLILLSTSHHVEEEIYTALVDDGHALQERYLIYREEERGERDG